jgi:hypothetical protein
MVRAILFASVLFRQCSLSSSRVLVGPVPQMKPEEETMDIDGEANTATSSHNIPQTQQQNTIYTPQGMCCYHPLS